MKAYILRTIIGLTYLYLMIFSVKFNLIPLIELYGGWYWTGINIAIAIAGALIGLAFAFTLGMNKKTGATPRAITPKYAPHVLTPDELKDVQSLSEHISSINKDT